MNLIVVWWGFFVRGYFLLLVGGLVGEEGIQIFLFGYGSLISASLQSDSFSCSSYSTPITWSKVQNCTIALFVYVPLCRQMDKTYIHICTGRLCVHKKSSANYKFRPLGEVCLLPGLHICLNGKKPECLFQNIWTHCKQVSKQISHAY